MEKPIKLHLGAGEKFYPGWVNVDICGDQDVISDLKDLPFDDEYADKIESVHVFEHFERVDSYLILSEWRRVLKPGGTLTLELPCLDKIAHKIVDGEKNLRMTLFGLFGDPNDENQYMRHKWCWSMEELAIELTRAGFLDIEFSMPFYHIPHRDMRVTARKGANHGITSRNSGPD